VERVVLVVQVQLHMPQVLLVTIRTPSKIHMQVVSYLLLHRREQMVALRDLEEVMQREVHQARAQPEQTVVQEVRERLRMLEVSQV
jgi:hypothetical protein